MESDVEQITADIVKAVKLIMNPLTPASERRQAHEMLENFKDTSPLCAKCGFLLSHKTFSPTIRHFGFQLIDNYIKLHWNEIDLDQKVYIKNSILQTIATGTESVLKEEVYVKDAVSRIVVELIKREWPQHWPSLMEELHNLCIMGDEQTELVLLIFSRLADDIVQFQNVQDVRRREIYRSLCTTLKALFEFFWKTLSTKSELYISSANQGVMNEHSLQTCRVIQVTLETLSTFVEWVPINYITDIPLFGLLSKLLEHENLQMAAVTCLLTIFDRKGKQRTDLLNFFNEGELFAIISALDENVLMSKEPYPFLKELCKFFCSLGTTLCSAMAQGLTTVPENFPLFLNCVMLFTKHPSVVLSQTAQVLWTNILRCPELSSSPPILILIPTLLKYEMPKLIKVGYLSKNDSPSSKFSLIDFDSDEDFEAYYSKSRANVADVLRLIANIQPKIAFSFCKTLMTSLIKEKSWKDILDSSCPEVDQKLYWEAMVTYIEAICNVLSKKDLHQSEEFKDDAFDMIVMCKDLCCNDPTILSYSLSCMSSLFYFYGFKPESCIETIDKIFSYFTLFPKDGAFAKEVQNLKRHATSLLIKLSINHSSLLMPMFKNICERIQSLFLIEDCLTSFDKCALSEALIILSNNFRDFEKQSEFLKAVISPVIGIWFSPAITVITESPEALISFLGVDKPCPPTSTNNILSKDSSDLIYSLNVIRACIKRCVRPSDQDETVPYRNPAAPLVIPVLEKIIRLLRSLNALHDPCVNKIIHPSFAGILSLSDTNRNLILGISITDNSSHQKTPFDRMKIFVQSLYEGCVYALGNAVENFGIDFYTIPDLPTLLKENILYKIEYMPAFNLKMLIRLFLRPFFLCCPPTAYDELMVVLAGLCPFMLQKLTAVWEKFKLRYGTSIGYEEQQTETEEILEDQLNRIVTREYITFLGKLLDQQNTCSNDEGVEDMHTENPVNQTKSLTELGLKIIATESVRAVFICTAFDSLRWLDTLANTRAVHLCELLFNKIIEDNLVRQIQEANYLLQSVLYGLQELGQHEANLGLMSTFGIVVYDSLRQRFPEIRYTLMSSVACSENSIEILDSTLVKNHLRAKNDKQKKDAFKSVIYKIIGTNLGQHHKKEVVIKNLPPLLCIKRKENSSLLDFEVNDDIGICNLFASE